MLKSLLPLALLLVPLLAACPELEDLTGNPSLPVPQPIQVTAKQKTLAHYDKQGKYIPDTYTLYYTNNTQKEVDRDTYLNTQIK